MCGKAQSYIRPFASIPELSTSYEHRIQAQKSRCFKTIFYHLQLHLVVHLRKEIVRKKNQIKSFKRERNSMSYYSGVAWKRKIALCTCKHTYLLYECRMCRVRISCRHKFNVVMIFFRIFLQYVHKNHHKCVRLYGIVRIGEWKSNKKKTRTHILYNLSTLYWKCNDFWV